ncbi:MAG: hypothetical protein RBS37_07710 [Bacteroidales bacterium]|jgi:hypothetical protein|nr:hypothetical protein [Bacteroidales bacterium]
MKQKIYVLGLVTFLIIFAGVFFKLNHWPGAGYMLMAGMMLLVLVFLPLALINHYKAQETGKHLLLHVVTWLTCLVVFTSMLFKIQHWPGAGILLFIALPFPYLVFLPVFLVSTAREKDFSIQNTVFILFLLALNSVFAALLALNVSRDKIEDSYNLARQYNRVERVLDEMSSGIEDSPVTISIDESLKVIREFKELILGAEGTSYSQWEEEAGVRLMTDSWNTRRKAFPIITEGVITGKLESALVNLVTESEKVYGTSGLTGDLPEILGLTPDDRNKLSLDLRYISGDLSWTLIWLDGLETNLKLLRLSLSD